MHPDTMREVALQRVAEQREAASHANLVRGLRRAIRAQRRCAESQDTFVAPAIPDYVDGTFGIAGEQVPNQRASAGC